MQLEQEELDDFFDRFEDLDVNAASAEEILERMTQSEMDAFHTSLKNANLSADLLKKSIVTPWWLSSGRRKITDLAQFSTLTKRAPSHKIVYNLVEILY